MPAEAIDLTAAQRGMWFAQRLDPDNAIYNIAEYVDIRGPLDRAAFAEALHRVLGEAEALRTTFHEHDGEPVQNVHPAPPAQLRTVDVSTEQDPEAAALDWMLADARTAVDPARDPLYLFALIDLGGERLQWYYRAHHLVLDGFSGGLIAGRTAEIYRELTGGQAPDPRRALGGLPELVEADAAYRASDGFAADREYWLDRFGDRPEPASLSGGQPVMPSSFHRCTGRLPDPVTDGLHRLARETNTSWPAVTAAAIALYMAKMTNTTDVVLGLPVAARRTGAARRIPGMVSNVLPLRIPVPATGTVAELARAAAEAMHGAIRHQHYRYEDLRRDLKLIGDDRRLVGPQINFLMFDADFSIPGCETVSHSLTVGPNDDMTFVVDGRPGRHGLAIDLHANGDVYEPGDVHRHAARFEHLLADLARSAPDRSLGRIEVATPAERDHLVHVLNDTGRDLGTLTALLEAQTSRTPEAEALVFDDETLTYRELHTRANRLAHRLIGLGIGPEDRVAVALHRSADLVVALLATLKAGAAYVPVDPGHPRDRIEYVLDDAQPTAVLTTTDTASHLPPTGCPFLCLDDAGTRADLARHPGTDPTDRDRTTPLRSSHPAYLIYTSGSTGRPKGVVVPHAGIVNRLRWMQDQYRLTGDDRILQKTPSGFDVSVWEFFWPLAEGATLVVARPDGHKDPAYLAEVIRAQRISTLHFVPSMLQAFLARAPFTEAFPALRRVVCSGEALPRETQRQFFAALPAVELHNLYGPTEASVDVTAWRCGPHDEGDSVPIGAPVWNTRAYVLDAALRPVPAGVPGELYLSGVQLARGYLNRSALTGERFVADPFRHGERMYRTGDLARWRDDGNLIFLGRSDDQVKIRGFRVELGEIEAALCDLDEVRQAAVILRSDGPGGSQLVGYVTLRSGTDARSADLRRALADRLPEYMIPAAVVILTDLPTTANGKLDRRALPAPDYGGLTTAAAARNEAEDILCRAFAEVLGLETVGVTDNFFDLGGDSIVAMRLVSRARARGLLLTAEDVFAYKTAEALAPRATATGTDDDEEAGPVGEVPTTPIMEWLRGRGERIDRFGQFALVQTPAGVRADHLGTALRALLTHHDVLRARLERFPSWRLRITDATDLTDGLEVVDVAGLDQDALAATVADHREAAANRLRPDDGVMVQAVWFDAGSTRPGRLLLVLHHLVVDGVSWRILLDDLESAYGAAAAGRTPDLGARGTSFRGWAHRLADEARSPRRTAELPAWTDQVARPAPLLPGGGRLDPARDTVARLVSLDTTLEPHLTEPLLTTVPARINGAVTDVLLTALLMAVPQWRGADEPGDGRLTVALEGHGRVPLTETHDLSRTVGWFTSLYPVTLGLDPATARAASQGGAATDDALKQIKEQLRAVPGDRIGYGLLRHHNPDTAAGLAARPGPDVGFNYLGRFDAAATDPHSWGLAPGEALGEITEPAMPAAYQLDINVMVRDGADGRRLTARWTWPEALVTEEAATRLAGLWQRCLEALITSAEQSDTVVQTPSDLTLNTLSQNELDALEDELAREWENAQ
ncbi:amino acid adenylation domain-containing protein [Streptomyces actinomycinicus]|uniref:Amino acid adenylation domain-containing protein n=1 Tax=Streptomyces actinomycinicus TaxID=1695166 RepID=A0A937EFI8_9ACTN|nr:non-ribosomal peptide synthetase [Streptomyces actinomycinicus]MBL1081149.1 amino acid adenylation domain-containing protein [Streptomyces actinomycinicus]